MEATLDEVWSSESLLKGHGLEREAPESWEAWPGGCRNFLDSLEPCLEVQTWRNRVDRKVNRVFEVCLGSESRHREMVRKAMAGLRAL